MRPCGRAVDAAWGFLEIVEDLDQLRYERRRARGQGRSGRDQRRGGLRGDSGAARWRRQAGEVGEGSRTGDAGRRQGRDRRGPSRGRFLRALLAAIRVGPAVDGPDRASGAGASPAGGRGPGRLHAVRIGGAGHRGRTGHRCAAGGARPRDLRGCRRSRTKAKASSSSSEREVHPGLAGATCDVQKRGYRLGSRI